MKADHKPAPILTMRGICKSFGSTIALKDVDFDLYPGEIHILAGENGAGKSTLVKILCGVHPEYSGRIAIEGKPVAFSSPHEAAAKGITAIHQELSLVPSMSVVDNIFLGREIQAKFGLINSSAQGKTARGILSKFGIDVDVQQSVEELPISLQQMIEIAKALAIDARIIIMDEPTSALTEPEVERLFETITSLKSQGRSIIYITHKMEELYRIADRITVLRDGRYIGTSTAAQLPKMDLIKWMVGREINEQFPQRMAGMKKEFLRVDNLTIYSEDRRKKLVDDVSFFVHSGEILGIAGLQGSGASELLNGIFGNYGRLKDGTAYIDGTPFEFISPRSSINRGLALLTNDRKTTGLVLGMSMTENITLASVPRYSPGYWIRKDREGQCAERQRKELDIRVAHVNMEMNALSGGNQQKVALAKWLETGPKILLLDEPTRGIDVGAKHEIYELMNKWTQAGCAILLITSEMPELLALSDRIIVMHRGRITSEFSRSEATQEKILHAAMG